MNEESENIAPAPRRLDKDGAARTRKFTPDNPRVFSGAPAAAFRRM
jgi:hypothetical protein